MGGESLADEVEDSSHGVYRLCVPTSKRREVLEQAHDAKSSGHMGARRTVGPGGKCQVWWKMGGSVKCGEREGGSVCGGRERDRREG